MGHGARRVLMIAYHFPPLAGSSGIQRTLRFVQQLPALGWQPIVIGASPHAFERSSPDLDAEVPEGVLVRRAFALDTARHLSIGGRYIGALARPDRWMTWQFDAIRQGMRLVREFSPDAIWSTYPIATAHLIGAELHRRTGIPWIADFRDPMAQDGYPSDPRVWKSFKEIEERAANEARLCCFTTPSAVTTYRSRYPQAADRFVLLENGFDEPTFAQAEAHPTQRASLNPGRVTLLHSGVVYPAERDPAQLIESLALIKAASAERAARLCVRFRASAHDSLLQELAARHAVGEMIDICPPVGYAEALGEMLCADALLVLQASNCNEQVPAKVYEYLRAGRPIISLTDVAGDTWGVLNRAGISRVAPLNDAHAIARFLSDFVDGSREGLVPEPREVARASRGARTVQLASWLDRINEPASAWPVEA